MQAFKVMAFQKLKHKDYGQKMSYCEWLLTNIADGYLDPHLYLMADKEWFHLSACIYFQNKRYWATTNSNEHFDVSPRVKKIGVWYAVFSRRIVRPFFFSNTVISEVYVKNYCNYL